MWWLLVLLTSAVVLAQPPPNPCVCTVPCVQTAGWWIDHRGQPAWQQVINAGLTVCGRPMAQVLADDSPLRNTDTNMLAQQFVATTLNLYAAGCAPPPVSACPCTLPDDYARAAALLATADTCAACPANSDCVALGYILRDYNYGRTTQHAGPPACHTPNPQCGSMCIALLALTGSCLVTLCAAFVFLVWRRRRLPAVLTPVDGQVSARLLN